MKKTFRLDCLSSNPRHTIFRVFDGEAGNCGTLTLLTEDVPFFIQNIWQGDVLWNGLCQEIAKLPQPATEPANH